MARQHAAMLLQLDPATLRVNKRIVSYQVEDTIKEEIKVLLERWGDDKFLTLLLAARGGKL